MIPVIFIPSQEYDLIYKQINIQLIPDFLLNLFCMYLFEIFLLTPDKSWRLLKSYCLQLIASRVDDNIFLGKISGIFQLVSGRI